MVGACHMRHPGGADDASGAAGAGGLPVGGAADQQADCQQQGQQLPNVPSVPLFCPFEKCSHLALSTS